jgi:hypothetical protein
MLPSFSWGWPISLPNSAKESEVGTKEGAADCETIRVGGGEGGWLADPCGVRRERAGWGQLVGLSGGGNPEDIQAGAGALEEGAEEAEGIGIVGHGGEFVDTEVLEDADADEAEPGGGSAAAAEGEVGGLAEEEDYEEGVGEEEEGEGQEEEDRGGGGKGGES